MPKLPDGAAQFFFAEELGHASVEQVASDAQKYKIKKLVFAHIGRPTIKAMDAGKLPVFGEFGKDGTVFKIGVNPGPVAVQPKGS